MKNILSCCALLFFAVGCIKNPNNNHGNQNGTDIFPNKIGDTWTYLVNDTLNSYQDPAIVTQYNMTVSVISAVQLVGGIEANVWVYDSPGTSDTNYVFQHGDTVSFASDINLYNGIIRQYIIPLQVQHSWEYSSNSVHDVTVISQSDIIVGQNHFNNAFNIQGYPGRPDEIISINEWIADYVGVVKRYLDASGTNNPIKHRTSWSLVSYQLL